MRLLRLRVVDSTQDFLIRHPELGFGAVLAGAQTLGRGQRGNTWESALDEGLWLSAALPVPAIPPGLIPQRAMAAVAEVLEAYGAVTGLKWPNDLVGRREGRLVKVGGILGQVKGDRLILGVGINLRSAPALAGRPIPPASLRELGCAVLPEPTALALEILEAWEDLTIHREPAFRWPEPGERLTWGTGQGCCEGWLPDGRLTVRTERGLEHLTAGDVYGLAET